MKISFRFQQQCFAGLSVVLLVASSCRQEKGTDDIPAGVRVLDERLSVSVFAEDPDIVTPIGIAADSAGQIFVLESHTHTPPKNYQGPGSDRIKVFVDADTDGEADTSWIYAEGLREGVNISFSPAGELYVVTSRTVYRLPDVDRNGIADGLEPVVRLDEPKKVYAHAALLGIAFSRDGWMYVSRGNTGGAAWRLTGSDSSAVSGYGDGGNIMRARADGSEVQEVATGFWNPADIKFDSDGRLLAADNDPDSRGPNRLVHVVDGGNYGYRSLYGGSGIHPYLAWNGELPGTLPFAVALGEAPSGLLDATHTSLPQDYKDNMLATIWEESRIVRIRLQPRGTSITGNTEVIIAGGNDFRPVALTHTSDGTVYFTDWVLREYPNHGHGRVWRLSAGAKESIAAVDDGNAVRSQRSEPSPETNSITEALASEDPFIRHRAVMHLSVARADQRRAALRHDSPAVRIGAMLAMQRSGDTPGAPALRRLLNDTDVDVRRQALQWIGESALTIARPYLSESLVGVIASPVLLETYLETVRHLQPAFIEAFRSKSEPYSKSIARPLPDGFLENFIQDKTLPAKLRAMAITHLSREKSNTSLLMSLLSEDHENEIRLNAVQALAGSNDESAARALLSIATDRSSDPQVRAEALLSLSWCPENLSNEIADLLNDPSFDVQVEAARYIRTKNSSDKAAELFAAITTNDPQLKEQFQKGQREEVRSGRFVDIAGDHFAGNPDRGRRVFYSPLSLCSTCHAFQGRGGDLGPDLTQVARSKSREQLIMAILEPSTQISPEYQGWFVRLLNGEQVQGRQIDIGENSIELYTPVQGFITFPKDSISDYGMIDTSLMPDGLHRNLTESDLHDLLAFLQRQ